MKYLLKKMAHSKGFTLIELLVVVGILAILTTVALPSYNSAVARSERAIAIQDISDIALAQARYYSSNRVYTNDYQELLMGPAGSSIEDTEGHYNINLTAPNAGQNYTITATPIAGKAKDEWTLSLTDTGLKQRKDKANTTHQGWPTY